MKHKLLLIVFITVLAVINDSIACSDIIMVDSYRLSSDTIVSGRNFDLDQDVMPSLQYINAGTEMNSLGSDGNTGRTWKNVYPFIAVDPTGALGKFIDGMNNQGLSAALLWMKEASFPTIATGSTAIAMSDLTAWILGNFKTVAEARNALVQSSVWQDNSLPYPAHLIIHDASGASLLVEWINGTAVYIDKTHNGYNGTVTNGPEYSKQLENLKNFSALGNEPPKMVGLPGDRTSMSRFVQLYTLAKYAKRIVYPPDTFICFGYAGILYGSDFIVQQIFHLLNRLTIVRGEAVHTYDGQEKASQTLLSLVRDHKNKIIYYRFNNDVVIKEFSFKGMPAIKNSVLVDSAATPVAIPPLKCVNKPAGNIQVENGKIKLSINYQSGASEEQDYIYIFGRNKNDSIFSWTGNGWRKVINGKIKPFDKLKSSVFSTVITMNKQFFQKHSNMKIYAGTGHSLIDMFVNENYRMIFTVPSPREAKMILYMMLKK